MTRDELLREIRDRLQIAYGKRLKGVVLYGSEARGEGGSDSDVDILVLLDHEPDMQDDLVAIDALYPLTLEYGHPLHPSCADIAEYEAAEFPLYIEARREGIPA